MRFIATYSLLLLLTLTTSAQTDDLFWFAAPEISTDWSNFDVPIVLRITSYGDAADVTITQPAGGGMPNQSISLAANSSQSVDLTPWLNSIENKPANAILNYGLKITSTAVVTIYYEVVSSQCQCNPEIFVLKGRNALGTDFMVPMQNFLDNNGGYTPVPYSSFDIVATENNTSVTITPSATIQGHAAGVPFTVILNEGQTYSATATSELAADHLMGSLVSSDKPIAVTYKDDLLSGTPFGGCADLGGDQIVPVSILGTEYIAINGFLNPPGDQLFVMATQDGTSVSYNGVPATTLNSGQTWTTALGIGSAYIEASAPVSVLQLSGFGCEVGLDIIPPIVCTGSSSVSFTRSTTESLYITLLVESGNEDNFLFNGNAGVITAGIFSPVPGTGGQWLVATMLFSLADTPLGTASLVSNTAGYFHLGFIHGGAGSGCRFGYFSNFANVEVDAHATAESVCTGEPIELFCNDITEATYSWTGPQGYSSSEQNPVIADAEILSAGDYAVVVAIPGCDTANDTVTIDIHEPTFSAQTVSLCPGESFVLPGGDSVSDADIYEDILVNQWNCDSTITTTVEIFDTPITLTSDTTLCLGQNIALHATGAISYTWSPVDGLSDSSSADVEASPEETTLYSVVFELANGCTTSENVLVEVTELPFVTTVTSAICQSPGSIEISPSDGIGPYSFTVGNVTQDQNLFEELQAQNYEVQVTDATGCTGNQTILVINEPYTLLFDVNVQPSICATPGSLEVVPSSAYPEPLQLSLDGVEQETLAVDGLLPGDYQVLLTDGHGCIGATIAQIEHLNPGHAQFTTDPLTGEPPLWVTFENTSLGLDSYSWNFGDGEYSSAVDTLHLYPESGIYTIVLFGTDTENGCADSASYTLVVSIPFLLFVPNTFTPDGDGINDVFRPICTSFENDHYLLRVFDRWGSTVFESTDATEPWIGNVSGGDHFAPNGSYSWMLVVRPFQNVEDKMYRGTVNLVR